MSKQRTAKGGENNEKEKSEVWEEEAQTHT
jgi:hypothetical protein